MFSAEFTTLFSWQPCGKAWTNANIKIGSHRMTMMARNYGAGFTDSVPALRQLRSRAPLRLGLAGGGTDLSDYSETYGGAVLNATIDRYAYAHVTFLNADYVRFRASDVGLSDELKASPELPTHEGLALHRAVYNRMVREFLGGKPPCVDVSTTVDAPPGSGLGSSSALVVALVEAYRAAFSLPLGRYDVARLAYEIERGDLALGGGKQDQYSSAFGGVNFMEFLPNDRVIVNPLRVSRSALNELEAALVICFTGQSRRSDSIIGEQVEGIRKEAAATIEGLHRLKADAIEMKTALLAGDLPCLAAILDRSWKAKQMTAEGISSPLIDMLYGTAMAHGAWAGKVSGAGGGGFMMFVTDPENRYRLVAAIRAAGVDASPVHFTDTGAEAWSVNP
jgi:D-glycero-alpha-D-manno-heptose-7-phosphate kinase